MTGATGTSNNPEEIDALVSDRDYFKHFSRVHEGRAKASWKTLHKVERLIESGDYEEALALIQSFLDNA